MKNLTIEYTDTLSEEIETRMTAGHIAYEKEHGIDIHYKTFAFVLLDENNVAYGVLNAHTAFAEVYMDKNVYQGDDYTFDATIAVSFSTPWNGSAIRTMKNIPLNKLMQIATLIPARDGKFKVEYIGLNIKKSGQVLPLTGCTRMELDGKLDAVIRIDASGCVIN